MPSKHKRKTEPFTGMMYFFAFAAPLFELPQLYSMYQAKSSANVSLLTWGFFAVSSFAWLIYAIRTKDKPLFVSYLLFSAIEAAVTVAILWFR